MTFINWSDPDEMLGLLFEYVADARNGVHGDPPRQRFLRFLYGELADLTDSASELSAGDIASRLRMIRDSVDPRFEGDHVMEHVDDCIRELERILGSTEAGG